jgi:hypothetical protein
MNREDIIRMAREAGCKPFRSPEHWDDVQVFATPNVLERFAALVAAAEREACAKVCDAVQKKNEDDGAWMWEARNCAAAIRARGEAEYERGEK